MKIKVRQFCRISIRNTKKKIIKTVLALVTLPNGKSGETSTGFLTFQMQDESIISIKKTMFNSRANRKRKIFYCIVQFFCFCFFFFEYGIDGKFTDNIRVVRC